MLYAHEKSEREEEREREREQQSLIKSPLKLQ